MNMEELTPHIEELKRVLGDKADEAVIVAELDTYLNKYHLDIDSAKRGIIRKLGGTSVGFVTAAAVQKKVGDLTGTEQNVDVVAKVIYVENKEITVKGSPKKIVSGIVGDDTGSSSFTVWRGDIQLEKGKVYRFKNCYTKKWNDRIQINIGDKGVIETADDVKIDMPERNYTMSSSEMKIGDIREGMGNVTVTGRILTSETRTINVKGEDKIVFSGIIADDTGKIQYSAWSDFQLKAGETICVKNAYIRAWKGIPQLNLGERCEVSRVDDTFDDAVIGGSNEKTVGDIIKNGGGLDIVLKGDIVDIRMGSGLIKRCPECNRSIINDQCMSHGTVNPVPDLRLKFVLDDGTGSISAILNRDITEKLTGVTLHMATELAKARGAEFVAKELAEKIMVKHVMIRGNVMSDDYGPSMSVKDAAIENVDVQAEARKLLKTVEAAL